MIDIVLSIMVLCAIALLAGAAWLWRRKQNLKQAGLMALLAFIMLVNVAIWTIPTDAGTALADSADVADSGGGGGD